MRGHGDGERLQRDFTPFLSLLVRDSAVQLLRIQLHTLHCLSTYVGQKQYHSLRPVHNYILVNWGFGGFFLFFYFLFLFFWGGGGGGGGVFL